MHLKKVIAAATIPAIVASPVAAANPAASLSLRRDSTEAAGSSEATAATAAAAAQPYAAAEAGSGISSPLLIGGLAVLLVVIGAVALGSGHHGMNSASA